MLKTLTFITPNILIIYFFDYINCSKGLTLTSTASRCTFVEVDLPVGIIRLSDHVTKFSLF